MTSLQGTRDSDITERIQSNSLFSPTLLALAWNYGHTSDPDIFSLDNSVTFFRRVLFGILMFITVVRTISPLSSDKLANRCLWSSLRQYFTNIT